MGTDGRTALESAGLSEVGRLGGLDTVHEVSGSRCGNPPFAVLELTGGSFAGVIVGTWLRVEVSEKP